MISQEIIKKLQAFEESANVAAEHYDRGIRVYRFGSGPEEEWFFSNGSAEGDLLPEDRLFFFTRSIEGFKATILSLKSIWALSRAELIDNLQQNLNLKTP
ncbi:hypothetical protein [Flavitalea sp.]|nr:hypothetical protein [Flavitalea sp.]